MAGDPENPARPGIRPPLKGNPGARPATRETSVPQQAAPRPQSSGATRETPVAFPADEPVVPLRQSSMKITRASDLPPPPAPLPSVPLPPKVESSRPQPRRVTESLDPVMPAPEPSNAAPPPSSTTSQEWKPSWEKEAEAAAAAVKPKKPLPVKLIAQIAGGVVACAAVAGVVVFVSNLAPPPPPPELSWSDADKGVMARLWRERAAAKGDVVADAKVAAAVDAVAATVLRDGVKSVVVVRDAAADAFALPDGGVVVTVGMLRALHNEAELAAVLAHARAHVQNGDVDRVLLEREDLRAGADAAVKGGAAAGALALVDAANAAVYGIDDEVHADAEAVHALKRVNWESGALQTAVDSAPAWTAHHPVDDVRRAAALAEQSWHVPGSNVVVKEAGRTNAPEYSQLVILLQRL